MNLTAIATELRRIAGKLGLPFHLPGGVIAVDCACELSFGGVPLAGWLEWNVRCGMMYHGEGAHPEVKAQPRKYPPLDKSDRSLSNKQGEQNSRGESSDSQPTYLRIPARYVRFTWIAC
jgi:hypothetical protein